jgi:transposase
MEQLDYNLLFRWFVGLATDAAVWDVTVFTKNRERLIEGEIATKFMAAVLRQPRITALLSDDHFSVDGTLIEAWAGMKSFRAERRQRLAARPRPQRRARLPRRDAQQRDPRLGRG